MLIYLSIYLSMNEETELVTRGTFKIVLRKISQHHVDFELVNQA